MCVCSVIICINKRQERQQYNTPITNNDTHKIHAQCSQLESHLSSAQLTLFTLWKSQKRVSYLVSPRKRHTISLFGVSIEFIIYFSFIFSADVLFPFTEISLCFHSAFIHNCSAVCFSRRTNQRDKKNEQRNVFTSCQVIYISLFVCSTHTHNLHSHILFTLALINIQCCTDIFRRFLNDYATDDDDLLFFFRSNT